MNTNDLAFLITLASFALPPKTAVTPEAGVPAAAGVVEASAAAADPQRVRIVRNGTTLTIATADRKLLRGIAVPVYLYQRQIGRSGFFANPKYWDMLESSGINAVRLVAFDPWQRSHGFPNSTQPFPFTDLNDPEETAALLTEMDTIVNFASSRGMHVMINYHDTGNYHDPDYSRPADANGRFAPLSTHQYLTRFWDLVAPRYANRTHVLYELTNEPVAWSSDAYSTADLVKFKMLYDQVRSLAPKTHLVMLSFATHFPQTSRTPRNVAIELKNLGVDFKNVSVGFHPYNARFPDANSSAPIRDLMRGFAVVNTEQNFPANLVPGSIDPDASGLDGDRMGTQSMERIGISWFHWYSGIPRDFRFNFQAHVVTDAIAKGYYWGPASSP